LPAANAEFPDHLRPFSKLFPEKGVEFRRRYRHSNCLPSHGMQAIKNGNAMKWMPRLQG